MVKLLYPTESYKISLDFSIIAEIWQSSRIHGNCRLLGPTTARECHKRLCVTTVKTFGSGCAQGHCLSKIILFDFFLLNLIFYKVSFLNFFYRFIRFHWDLPKEGKICRVRVQIVRFAWEFKICHVTVFMTNKLITFFFCCNSRLISSN